MVPASQSHQVREPDERDHYRVWLDQALMAPVAVGFFFGAMSILEGKGVSDAVERISENYQPTLIRNWSVFVPTQLINFALVPHHLRFGVVSVVSLFWNTYLSAVNARTQQENNYEAHGLIFIATHNHHC
ncbi:hypothetical protein JVU11DRAFT_8620 [Chiua virens]|nr:hypothetical protein JVU11DRAFT_8620 [Chiua virens]